jgi:hypothetical protein
MFNYINNVVADSISIIPDNEVVASIFLPYVDNPPKGFGVLDTRLSDRCQVEQIHVLRQRGSRYSTSTRPLSFLSTWSLRLTVDSLVPTDVAEEYQSGTNTNAFCTILNPITVKLVVENRYSETTKLLSFGLQFSIAMKITIRWMAFLLVTIYSYLQL